MINCVMFTSCFCRILQKWPVSKFNAICWIWFLVRAILWRQKLCFQCRNNMFAPGLRCVQDVMALLTNVRFEKMRSCPTDRHFFFLRLLSALDITLTLRSIIFSSSSLFHFDLRRPKTAFSINPTFFSPVLTATK